MCPKNRDHAGHQQPFPPISKTALAWRRELPHRHCSKQEGAIEPKGASKQPEEDQQPSVDCRSQPEGVFGG
eukprot:15047902-Alexandrium_andersonii.AAC.1